jgi:deoxyribonuclease V
VKIPRAPHRWSLTPREAVAVQRRLVDRVSRVAPKQSPRLIAGLDAAFTRDGERCIAGAVLWDIDRREVIEEHFATRPLRFPYVPGLLSFRETPALLAALRKLDHTPDAVMCDGHGIAHPRRFGIACHVGVLIDLPSIGCGKSRLVGEEREPARRRGSRTRLVHRGETIGALLRTREGVKPVYVSIGHRMDQKTAERVTLACAIGYRLPEPTRLADRLVARAKRKIG